MKIHIAISFILFFILIGTSCQDKKRTQQINELEKLTGTLDSLNEIAESNRVDTLPLLINHIKENTFRFSQLYVADSIDYEKARLMKDYKEIRKAMSKNSGNLAKVRQSIPEIKEKANDLKTDIKNGAGEREKYDEYIGFEKNKLFQVEEILNYYLETKEHYTNLFHETEPKVQALIVSLENEN